MKFNESMLLLYAVTDRAWVGKQTLLEQIEDALKGGATFLQLREKNLCDSEFLLEAKAIQELCREYKVPFIINDNTYTWVYLIQNLDSCTLCTDY